MFTLGFFHQWHMNCDVISQWPEIGQLKEFHSESDTLLSRDQRIVTNGLEKHFVFPPSLKEEFGKTEPSC